MKREGAAAPLASATWRQKDGQVLALSELTNSHLYYALRLMVRRANVMSTIRQSRLGLLYRERNRRERKNAGGGKAVYYMLDKGVPRRAKNVVEWGEWFETTKDRVVAFTTIKEGVEVSTVFVGLESVDDATTAPLLWETLVFGGVRDGARMRHSTRAEAQRGHAYEVEETRRAERQAERALKQAALPVGVVDAPPLLELATERRITLEKAATAPASSDNIINVKGGR